jgi:hypothetical protein
MHEGEIFLPKFGGYLSQWQFFLSHSGHENEEFVVIEEHRNYYSIKSTDFRHGNPSFLFLASN